MRSTEKDQRTTQLILAWFPWGKTVHGKGWLLRSILTKRFIGSQNMTTFLLELSYLRRKIQWQNLCAVSLSTTLMKGATHIKVFLSPLLNHRNYFKCFDRSKLGSKLWSSILRKFLIGVWPRRCKLAPALIKYLTWAWANTRKNLRLFQNHVTPKNCMCTLQTFSERPIPRRNKIIYFRDSFIELFFLKHFRGFFDVLVSIGFWCVFSRMFCIGLNMKFHSS